MYFDYAATSLKRKDVLTNLISKIEDFDGNPSSMHELGRNTNKYIEFARGKIANEIGAKSNQIVFTSGASEANNIVISNFDSKDIEIISSNIEHKSILEPLNNTKSKVVLIKTNKNGQISLEDLKNSINENTRLVSIIYVNNETGVIQPIKEIGDYLRDKNIWFHVDAVQALGHIDINIDGLNCDSLSLSGHKIGGLNGFGVLFARNRLKSIILGGNQERGQRAGTSNLLGALSMSESIDKINIEREYTSELKNYFLEKLKILEFEVNGDIELSANHIVNIYFPFIKSDLLITKLDLKNIYVSAGSACNAGSLEPSYVINDMYDINRAKHSIRFSFGFSNTKEEIDELVNVLYEIYIGKSKK